MPCVSWERIMPSYLKTIAECFVLPIILRTFAPKASRADTRKSGLANRAIALSHGGQGTMRKNSIHFKNKNVMQQSIYYIKFALQFADMQITELVNIFNR